MAKRDRWRQEVLFWGLDFVTLDIYTDSALAAHKYEAHGLIAKEGL